MAANQTTSLSAQQTFEPGYLIDAAGQRSEVLILNRDWRYHPAEIEVIRGQDADATRITTESLEEFGIDGKARYVNREVVIEKSSVEGLSPPDTIPVPQRERVLLRVEVEGEATLYSYLAPRVSKYFLAVGDGEPAALTYHRSLLENGQLSVRLRCGGIQRLCRR